MGQDQSQVKENLGSIRHSYKMWLFPLVVVGFIGLSLVFLLLPGLTKVIESKEKLEKLEGELGRLEEKRAYLESLSEDDLNKEWQIVDEALPSKKPVFLLLASLNGLEKEADVKMDSYNLSPGSLATEAAELTKRDNPGELSTVPVEISFQGTFESITNLLGLFEKMKPLVEVNQVDLLRYVNDGVESVGANLLISMQYSLPIERIGKVSDTIQELEPADEDLLGSLKELKSYRMYGVDLPLGIDQNRGNVFEY